MTRNTNPLGTRYEARAPHPQNAVELFAGWTGAFPENCAVTAGDLALYADPRIAWAAEQCGTLEGKSVLELGPLEGAHTYMLEQYGAAEILAIEANKDAYLKCLISKELLGLTRSRFLLGDFERYLEETDRHFDIILASGVLYHMQAPVHVLDLIGQHCETLILWTHYFDPQAMDAQDPRRKPFSGQTTTLDHKGHSYRLHSRSYKGAWTANSYCGGPEDQHYWMERDDIMALCAQNGFTDIRTEFQDDSHVNGPSCLFYMHKGA